MKKNIKITDAKPEDVNGIRDVQKITWLDTYPNAEFGITVDDIEKRFDDSPQNKKRLLERKKTINKNPDEHVWIAKDDDQIVGFCIAKKEQGSGRIGAVYVLPQYQSKGIGKKLMSAGIKWLKTKKILVNVASYNQKGIEFYKSFGFIETGKPVIESVRPFASGVSIPEIELARK
ncbi:GNAT family N-acetyltransferase [Candidatus Gottesmanbacteria bacterium]|nr:GNAT family N-acetyltransferase [Candidatus Gottesmanbacteria bacterium]